MRKQGDIQKHIYKWKITHYHDPSKEVEIMCKLYKTVSEIILDFPTLNKDRVCNHLRGLSNGKLGTSKNIFSKILIEKTRIVF